MASGGGLSPSDLEKASLKLRNSRATSKAVRTGGVASGRVGKERVRADSKSDTKSMAGSMMSEPKDGYEELVEDLVEDLEQTREHMLSPLERRYTQQRGMAGAKELSLPRQPGWSNMDMIFNARMFLTMYVFEPICGISNQTGSSSVPIAVWPMYTFNVGNLGFYIDSYARLRLSQILQSNLNIRVKNIKGSLKTVGITAPFVTAADGQSSTNSQLTATALVGHGLERLTGLVEGNITIPSSGTIRPTKFESPLEGDGKWWAKTAVAQTGITTNNTIFPLTERVGSCQFKEYDRVSANVVNNPISLEVETENNCTKHMTSIDLTQSQGEILSWDYQMHDSFLGVKSFSTVQNQLQFDCAPDFAYLKDNASTIAQVPNFRSTGDQVGFLDSSKINKFFMTNYNADYAGAGGARHQTLPPKAYLQLVPPPTIDETKIQDFFVSTVLDTELVLNASGSSIGPDALTDDYVYIPKNTFTGFVNSFVNGGRYLPASGNGLIKLG